MPSWPRGLGLLSILLLCAFPVRAQITFVASAPVIDSFPVIRVGVSVTESGGPANTLSAANFTVQEDGTPVTNFQLVGCSGVPNAAIAFVIDTSVSMDGSVGTGPNWNRSFTAINNSFSTFLKNIPGSSELAIIPFADSSLYWYPGVAKKFYSSSVTSDTNQFMANIANLVYDGRLTNVDRGVMMGANVLAKSALTRKALILITDDVITDEDSVIAYLNAQGITLYVMEVARDLSTPVFNNVDVALRTGGDYFAANDTTLYSQDMAAIAHQIFSEHCTIRYVSTAACPWLKTHTIDIGLSYKTANLAAQGKYTLGKNYRDTIPPILTVDSSHFTVRVVHALDPYPCESGLKSFIDSALKNFYRVRLPLLTGSTATDSLIVSDTMQPADAYYITRDSLGNVSRLHVHYEPKPDVNAPQIATPTVVAGAYTMVVQEALPWDRGLKSISLTGAVNMVLDNVTYTSKSYSTVRFHIPIVKDSASGCIVATDSVGNVNQLCVNWFGENNDNLAPQFAQDPLAEPRVKLSGIATETRLHDKGIRQVIVKPLWNATSAQIAYVNTQKATVSVVLPDSLFSSRTAVEVTDSLGNFVRDTLRYEPLPDTAIPQYQVATPVSGTFDISVTETRPWDRGISVIQLLSSSVNVNPAVPFFLDARHANITVSVMDPTLNATGQLLAIDSVGHQVPITVSYTGVNGNPIRPLSDTVIDFGTVIPPTSIQRKANLTNTNDASIVVSIGAPTGDDSVFSLINTNQFPLGAHNTEVLTFDFHPKWLGDWRADYPVMDGTTKLSTITLIGRSVGLVKLSIDTVAVAHQGLHDTLRVSIDAVPRPINLDTFDFTLTYDRDVITMDNFVARPLGALDTGIALYDVTWISGSEGNRTARLIRRSKAVATSLSFDRTVLQIPIKTFLAKSDSTIVHISQTSSRLAPNAETHDGLVRVGDTCGTAITRAAMGGRLSAAIDGISPNPARSNLTVSITSQLNTDAELRIVSLKGMIQSRLPVQLTRGTQSVMVNRIPTTGTYQLQLIVDHVPVSTQKIEIVR